MKRAIFGNCFRMGPTGGWRVAPGGGGGGGGGGGRRRDTSGGMQEEAQEVQAIFGDCW